MIINKRLLEKAKNATRRKWNKLRGSAYFSELLDKTKYIEFNHKCDRSLVSILRYSYLGDYNKLLQNEFSFFEQSLTFDDQINWNDPRLPEFPEMWKAQFMKQEYLIDSVLLYKKFGNLKMYDFFLRTISDFLRSLQEDESAENELFWNAEILAHRIVVWIKSYIITEPYLKHEFKAEMLHGLLFQCELLYDNIPATSMVIPPSRFLKL